MKTAKKILNNKMAMIGLFIVSIIVFFGLFGPMIASHDPMEMDLYNIGAAPNDDHIWGTDEMGRDIFSRVIVGARTSLDNRCCRGVYWMRCRNSHRIDLWIFWRDY